MIMTNSKVEQALAGLVALLMLSYLIILNYKVPFLAMDELAFVAKMQGGVESRLVYGRPSHVIGYGINMLIDFFTPDFIGLTKRLITMIVLFTSITATLIHFNLPRTRSIIVAAFAIMAHQVDWQHNGFVAFFGGYNLFLASFLWALILDESARKVLSIYVLSFILIFLSFTSELFVVLSLIYIIAKAVQIRSFSPIYKGPIALATWSYIFFYILLRVIYYDASIRYGGVSSTTYAMGSLSAFSPVDIVTGSLIYFINSVPYFSSLNISNFATVCIASSLASGLVILSIRVFCLSLSSSASNHNNLGGVRSAAFLITLCALAFFPSVLIALQPMKLEWILSGTSRRYAFSLYEWLALVMIATIFIKHSRITKSFVVSAVLVVAAFFMLLNSVLSNLRFADSYADSLDKWRKIDKAILSSKSATVKLPIEWLEHPNIISLVSPQGHRLVDVVKLIAINNYGKHAIFCYNSNDFSLTIGKAVGAIELHGFSDAEGSAMWTNSSVPEIRFMRKFNKNDVIELSLVNAYAANSELSIDYEIGSNLTKSIFLQNKKVLIPLNQSLENPTLFIHIPKPISPLELGLGNDSRSLGVMVNKVRVGAVQNGQLSFAPAEQCI